MEHGSDDRPLKILVVDDEDWMRRMFTKALGEAKFWCASTGAGEEAIELLETQQFDLAVIDKNLPDVSGIEVARQARTSIPPVPVIIVTGYPTDESEEEARQLGVSGYLKKPFGLYELQRQVHDALETGKSVPPSFLERQKPTEPPPHRRRSSVESKDLSVLVLEPDNKVRAQVSSALTRAGYKVVAFQSQHQAETHVRHTGYDILVASPNTLKETRHWAGLKRGNNPLGSIAISTKPGTKLDAATLGAHGVFAAPFEESSIEIEMREAIARMRRFNR